MATHSNILAWEIPWTEEPGGLGVAKESDNDLVTKPQQQQIDKHTHIQRALKINTNETGRIET